MQNTGTYGKPTFLFSSLHYCIKLTVGATVNVYDADDVGGGDAINGGMVATTLRCDSGDDGEGSTGSRRRGSPHAPWQGTGSGAGADKRGVGARRLSDAGSCQRGSPCAPLQGTGSGAGAYRCWVGHTGAEQRRVMLLVLWLVLWYRRWWYRRCFVVAGGGTNSMLASTDVVPALVLTVMVHCGTPLVLCTAGAVPPLLCTGSCVTARGVVPQVVVMTVVTGVMAQQFKVGFVGLLVLYHWYCVLSVCWYRCLWYLL